MYKLKNSILAIRIVTVSIIFATFSQGACEKDNDSSNVSDNVGTGAYETLVGTNYPVVGTNQTLYYNNNSTTSAPNVGQSFYGQDAFYLGNVPKYKDNDDGTVSDLITGLMWEKTTDKNGDGTINASDKLYADYAKAATSSCKTGGYNDWRLPSIKELYSLIMFNGAEASPQGTTYNAPFIDTKYFSFGPGDLSAGERIIDAQYATSTVYVDITMGGNRTMFGVNFCDGRIKGYPTDTVTIKKKYYVMYVRNNPEYGVNKFVDNGDGTITDNATGLIWMQTDSEKGMNWESALSYAESFEYAGHSDWRLPDSKELQSIVDYTRSPGTTNSAAIDPMFKCTQITNEAGNADYAYYWTNTTFCSGTTSEGSCACYVSFGRAMGKMNGSWIDVHGAGCQRSDPKTGDASMFPDGHGPQGDAIRIYNYVRLVRTDK